ncbi:MAG: ATP-binding protein [Bacteroidetes bacterium]|uniref:ATP-binding protein n=1 Tax=Candidatus Cryptobacteroides excrementavium TaxID=2840759 RepID=A0A9D9NRE4_9BACT|nr:ATP-binding protein [Candidatus Cryptobacteroides excrementavium]
MRIFKRKIYDRMLEWKHEANGKRALLIQGARRIGKSTIVEEFAKKEYSSYLLIDFNKASASVKSLFNDLMDIDFLFLQLQTIYNVSLENRKSLIVFDEVQKCPMARQAIKYLVQDGRYDYIETGSLISIRQNTKDITIPSEEERIDMHPMDFEEFLWATGDTASAPLIRSFYEKRLPLAAAHRSKEKDIRLYMLVGGMPQAVNEYLDTNDLSKVDAIKRNIIQLYSDDFLKLDPSGKTSRLFMSIPSQLSKNMSRYYPSAAIGSIDSKKEEELLANLEDSKTVLVSYHADDLNVGMSLTKDISKYKLYVSDTGLFITMVFWDKSFTENVIYRKLIADKLEANLGYVYENLVAQMLTATGNNLFYYTFEKDEKHSYEIDFLLSRGSKICPVEVKSSGYRTHASLDAFRNKFSSRIKQSYILYTKDVQKDGDLLFLPFYMAELI